MGDECDCDGAILLFCGFGGQGLAVEKDGAMGRRCGCETSGLGQSGFFVGSHRSGRRRRHIRDE